MPNEPAAPTPTLRSFIRQSPDDGSYFLAGSRCENCGAVYAGERAVCASCCARDAMTSIRLAETGTLYAYTIVHRSFPGVKTPFVDVIVDLDGGGHLKGTLEGVPADPAALRFDMRVRLAFRKAVPLGGLNCPHLTYMFVPA